MDCPFSPGDWVYICKEPEELNVLNRHPLLHFGSSGIVRQIHQHEDNCLHSFSICCVFEDLPSSWWVYEDEIAHELADVDLELTGLL